LLSIRRKGRESRGEQAGFPAMYAAVSTRSLRAAKPGEARARKERDARIGKNRPSGLLARHMEIGLDQQQQEEEHGRPPGRANIPRPLAASLLDFGSDHDLSTSQVTSQL
jgi:hypothetical protein